MSIRSTGNYPPTVRGATCVYCAGDLRWRVQGGKIPFIAGNAAPRFHFKTTLASFFHPPPVQPRPELCRLVFPILGDDGYLFGNLFVCITIREYASFMTSLRSCNREEISQREARSMV